MTAANVSCSTCLLKPTSGASCNNLMWFFWCFLLSDTLVFLPLVAYAYPHRPFYWDAVHTLKQCIYSISLGDSRCYPRYMGSCQPWRRPSWCPWLLAFSLAQPQLQQITGEWTSRQKMSLSVSLFLCVMLIFK